MKMKLVCLSIISSILVVVAITFEPPVSKAEQGIKPAAAPTPLRRVPPRTAPTPKKWRAEIPEGMKKAGATNPPITAITKDKKPGNTGSPTGGQGVRRKKPKHKR